MASPGCWSYGKWYGDEEGDRDARRDPARPDSGARRSWVGAERFGIRPAFGRGRVGRRSRMGRALGRGPPPDGRHPVGGGARLGRWDPGSHVGSRHGGLMPGVTLDVGALIALEHDDRRVLVLLARARETGAHVTIPATALAQVVRAPARQAGAREPGPPATPRAPAPAGFAGARPRQVRLARLVRQPTTDVVPLGRVDATSVGRLLAASGTADIADAHVVICARRAAQRVVTSDPDDLLVLDPDLRVVRV